MKHDPALEIYLAELLRTIKLYPQAQRENEEARLPGIEKMLEYQRRTSGKSETRYDAS